MREVEGATAEGKEFRPGLAFPPLPAVMFSQHFERQPMAARSSTTADFAIKPLPVWRAVLLLLLLTVIVAPAPAQRSDDPTTPTLRAPQLLRIGFLRRETGGHPAGGLLEGLRAHLLADAAVVAALEAEGYSGIGLFASDGASDMLRRINSREFDVAFAPAVLYARQDAGYTPILKSRRPEEIIAPQKVWRQGVVIVSSRSPFFQGDTVDPAQLRSFLAQNRLGVVSTQSVAGFHAALLGLAVDYGVVAPEGGYLFFENSEEVAKAVIAGLVEMGACEESALARVLESEGLSDRREEFVRVILRTDRIVTDPVLVRGRLSTRHSLLGRELQNSIRQYSLGGGFGHIQYAQANDGDYVALGELLRDFALRVGELPP